MQWGGSAAAKRLITTVLEVSDDIFIDDHCGIRFFHGHNRKLDLFHSALFVTKYHRRTAPVTKHISYFTKSHEPDLCSAF